MASFRGKSNQFNLKSSRSGRDRSVSLQISLGNTSDVIAPTFTASSNVSAMPWCRLSVSFPKSPYEARTLNLKRQSLFIVTNFTVSIVYCDMLCHFNCMALGVQWSELTPKLWYTCYGPPKPVPFLTGFNCALRQGIATTVIMFIIEWLASKWAWCMVCFRVMFILMSMLCFIENTRDNRLTFIFLSCHH